MSARGTRATDALARAGVPFRVHEYEPPARRGPDRGARPAYGREAAAALGVGEDRVFKTLVVDVDGRLALAIVPVAASLDLKRLAAALDGRRAELAEAAVAERATGYVVGGISPIGGRRRLPAVLDASASGQATILVSAGRRGLQVELAPADLERAAAATVAAITRPDA
ncbi:MAG TPA: aminoacyl-tRNA deacylase [Candidatus Limnocylindrales bacterium]|nr:aminoacyl-tRNA deacylase [Candidatus Limnocylindrales bacterium]